MSYAVSITQDGTRLDTAGKYVDQDIVVGMSDSIKKAAQTYTPTTTDQTIAAGQFLSGAQTVKGDANLVSNNIKQGVSIFGVAGGLSVPNAYITTATFPSRVSGIQQIADVPNEVISHVNDATFSVSFSLAHNVTDALITTNTFVGNAEIGKPEDIHPIYGSGIKNGATIACYYPANSTSSDSSLGGVSVIYHTGNKFYIKQDYYILGTYNVVFSW